MEYKYNTVNELNHFIFKEAVVGDIQMMDGMFQIVLDNVKIQPENSKNRDIRTMRTNELLLKIEEAEITSVVKEGYRLLDADGKLKNTYEDEEVDRTGYKEVQESIVEGTVYELTLENGVYRFLIDGTDDRTYSLKVTGAGDYESWNRFLEI